MKVVNKTGVPNNQIAFFYKICKLYVNAVKVSDYCIEEPVAKEKQKRDQHFKTNVSSLLAIIRPTKVHSENPKTCTF